MPAARGTPLRQEERRRRQPLIQILSRSCSTMTAQCGATSAKSWRQAKQDKQPATAAAALAAALAPYQHALGWRGSAACQAACTTQRWHGHTAWTAGQGWWW